MKKKMGEKIVFKKDNSLICEDLSDAYCASIVEESTHNGKRANFKLMDEQGTTIIFISFYDGYNDFLTDIESVVHILNRLKEYDFFTENQCGRFMDKVLGYVQEIYEEKTEKIEEKITSEDKKFDPSEIQREIESLTKDL